MLALGQIGQASEGLGQKVTTIGDWTIYRDSDAMTDVVTCLGIYQGRPAVQLTKDSIAISLNGRGGISSYKYRLDDTPPTELRLATDTEKDIGAVVFEGDDFNAIRSANRFRFQALTILDSVVDEDISLRTAQQALAYMSGPNCQKK
ncbi:MAG TPA: hypothetical protein VG387_09410 [Rhizomicrobium sp.]|nr:hypothetical protein [Rhizomicrobium sp.]